MSDLENDDLLDKIYAAAINPDQWPAAMEHLTDLVTGSTAWLAQMSFADGSGARLEDATVRIDPQWKTDFINHFAACNPLNVVKNPSAFAREWTPKILTDEDLLAKDELVRTEYYNDYMRPHGTHSVMMIRLSISGDTTASLSIARTFDAGQFSADDVALVKRYYPHLLRAFGLGQQVLDQQRLIAELTESLDLSPHAVILLDASARIRFASRSAQRLFASRCGIGVFNGALRLSSAPASARLRALIAAAASPDATVRTGGSMSLARPDRRWPLSITVAPVAADTIALLGGGPSVLVTIADPEARVTLPTDRLREVFGLTPAQARVALALFEGATPREAAAALGLSPHTVHVHLAHIYEKTGANRQAELVQLLMRTVTSRLD